MRISIVDNSTREHSNTFVSNCTCSALRVLEQRLGPFERFNIRTELSGRNQPITDSPRGPLPVETFERIFHGNIPASEVSKAHGLALAIAGRTVIFFALNVRHGVLHARVNARRIETHARASFMRGNGVRNEVNGSRRHTKSIISLSHDLWEEKGRRVYEKGVQ